MSVSAFLSQTRNEGDVVQMLFVLLEIIAILLFIIGCIGSMKKRMNTKQMHYENSNEI